MYQNTLPLLKKSYFQKTHFRKNQVFSLLTSHLNQSLFDKSTQGQNRLRKVITIKL